MTVLKNIVKDRVLQITVILTFISLFLARPRLEDINFHTLWSIAAMLTIIQTFAYLHVLDILAYQMTRYANDTRKLTIMFTLLALISGMFLTNDITVLTLVPLYLNIAKKYQLPQIMPITLIGMAANIGVAFTPWGNPHNLFVVDHFGIDFITFFHWSTRLLLVGLLLLALTFFFLKKRTIPVETVENIHIAWKPALITTLIALFFFLGVFRIVPIWLPAICAIIWALMLKPQIMLRLDYALLLTFTCFFIFISDIQQVPLIVALISTTMFSEHAVYLTSIVSSQFISNVPATILVSKFTHYAEALFYGSNIGGFGSVVGSMANMLVFKTFAEHGSVTHKHFFLYFSAIEFSALFFLVIAGWLLIDLS